MGFVIYLYSILMIYVCFLGVNLDGESITPFNLCYSMIFNDRGVVFYGEYK
jgi:hypothetical protein